MFINRLITLLLRVLGGVDKGDWTKVLNLVETAEGKFETGAERGEWVDGQVNSLLSYAAPYARSMLISLAVGWLNKKGVIHVSKTAEVKANVLGYVEEKLGDK